MVAIEQIDVHDDNQLRAWYAVETASVLHDRPDGAHRTFEALAASVQNPSSQRRWVLLAAKIDQVTVGIAELTLHRGDNAHVVDLEIHVAPQQRRRGTGRALHDAADRIRREERCTTCLGEVSVPPEAALAFAEAMGFEVAHEEDHLVLDLPAAPSAGPVAQGYEVLVWPGACPEELLESYVRLHNQMEADVPVGEVERAATVHTPESIRESETRTGRSYDRVTAAVRHVATGEWAGYSLVFVPRGSDEAIQDDTLVMPAHRGHGLGHALKVATLDAVSAAYPHLRRWHTWTDPENSAMQRANRAFGYRAVERMVEVQRRDPA